MGVGQQVMSKALDRVGKEGRGFLAARSIPKCGGLGHGNRRQVDDIITRTRLDALDLTGIAVAVEADDDGRDGGGREHVRSEEQTSEIKSLMRISNAVFCL